MRCETLPMKSHDTALGALPPLEPAAAWELPKGVPVSLKAECSRHKDVRAVVDQEQALG